MTALTRFFFRAPSVAPTTRAILSWWESRRLAYNLSVGAAGLTSLAVVMAASALPPHGRIEGIPWQGIIVYGVLANVFYSAGPVLDVFIVRRWGAGYAAVGPALFRYGYAFAMGLSLLPIPLAALGWVLRALNGL